MSGPHRNYEHFPSPISDDDFRLGMMAPFAYERADLAKAIVRHCRRRDDQLERDIMTSRQRKAVERFKHAGSWNLGDLKNLADLRKFFEIFNDVFFDGILTGYCKVDFISHEAAAGRRRHHERRRGRIPCDGYCDLAMDWDPKDPNILRETAFAQIWVKEAIGSPRRSVNRLLSVLAHEMLHAVFQIFACKCQNTTAYYPEYGYSPFEPRNGGHCLDFMMAAKAIEEATCVWLRPYSAPGYFTGTSIIDALLSLDLDLGRIDTFVYTVFEGYNIPVAAELQRVGLDIVEIIEEVNSRRFGPVADRDMDDEDPYQFKPLKGNACTQDIETVDRWDLVSHTLARRYWAARNAFEIRDDNIKIRQLRRLRGEPERQEDDGDSETERLSW